ncbi:MAG: alpha/beta hydrolase [Bacteroidetes bacterium]|nr:alpha/beta hydrolase [Bacteroidota bacterium]
MLKQSLSYYLLLLVLKLKGVKKDFSQDPINFRRIRNGDIHAPGVSFFSGKKLSIFKIAASTITELMGANTSKELILMVHGGAFISGPTDLHWKVLKKIAAKTGQTVWLCDYPKAPENQISAISMNIDKVYERALEEYPPDRISLLGDSVGATLIIALTQRLIQGNQEPPSKLILVSPVMDASMSNPKIAEIDVKDPMLSQAGVLSAKKMCTGEIDLKNVIISPLYASFNGFPKTTLFLGQKDITYPDQQLAVKKMEAEGVKVELILGEDMPHIWPFLPVMSEARLALDQLINRLNT